MALSDINFFHGDIQLNNNDIFTDDDYDPEKTIRNRLSTLLYKVLVYDGSLKEQFKGLRVNGGSKFELEKNIVDFALGKIKAKYSLEELTFLIESECLIIKNTAFLVFFYRDSYDKPRLLLNYEETL